MMVLLEQSSSFNSSDIQEARSKFLHIALYMFESEIDHDFDTMIFERLDRLITIFTNISSDDTTFNQLSKKHLCSLFSSIEANDEEHGILTIQENLLQIMQGFNPAPLKPSPIYLKGLDQATKLLFKQYAGAFDTPEKIQTKIDSLKEYILIVCSPQMLGLNLLVEKNIMWFLKGFSEIPQITEVQKEVFIPLISLFQNKFRNSLDDLKARRESDPTADYDQNALPIELFYSFSSLYDNLPTASRSAFNSSKCLLEELKSFSPPTKVVTLIDSFLENIEHNMVLLSLD